MAVIVKSIKPDGIYTNGLGVYRVQVRGALIRVPLSAEDAAAYGVGSLPFETRWLWLAKRKERQLKRRLMDCELRDNWQLVGKTPDHPNPPAPPAHGCCKRDDADMGDGKMLVTQTCCFCGRRTEHVCKGQK